MARKLRNDIWFASYNVMAEKYGTLAPDVETAAKITGVSTRNVCDQFPDGWSGN